MRGGGVLGGLVAVVGGLVLAGTAVGQWTVHVLTTDVGGVPIEEMTGVTGTEVAPAALPLGVLAVIVGLLSLAARGTLASALGIVLAGVGGGAQVVVVLGITRALELEGSLAAAPFFAFAGAFAVTVAGFLGRRRSREGTVLPARYELDEADEDEAEWRLASEDPGVERHE